jgi:Helix-turn-helix domain
LPAATQAALRHRAVRAVLAGMTQAQAARVFGVHHNAVNQGVKRYRQGGWEGLANGAAVAVQANRPPCPNRNSRRSSRWFARAPRTSSAWRGCCGPKRQSPS